MKCFNHHDRDAFGICQFCGKALCLECMESVNNKIVCKDNPKCRDKASACCCNKGLGFYAGVLFVTVGAIGLISSAFDFEFGRSFFAIVSLLIGLNLIKGY